MDNKLAVDQAEARQAAELKALSLRQAAIALEQKNVAKMEEETSKRLHREKIELEKTSKIRDEETVKLVAKKAKMVQEVGQLKEETRKTEERMLKQGMKWDGRKPFDSTDINEKVQEETRKQMEALVQGYAGTLQAHHAIKNLPRDGSLPQYQQVQQQPAHSINIVIGCNGDRCKKRQKKQPDNQHDDAMKDSAVKEAVEKQLKAIKEDREVEDGDRLERRRLELEHDQRVQEMAANDVKKALEEKKKSEEKVEFMSAQLNGQRKETLDAKSDLAHEKAVSADLSQKNEERKEKLQEIAASATRR